MSNVARDITAILRGAKHYRIPLTLLDGGKINISESIYIPSNATLEGYGYASRLHRTGSFPIFVFQNVDASASTGFVVRDLRVTDDDEAEIPMTRAVGSVGRAENLWLPTLDEVVAIIDAVSSS